MGRMIVLGRSLGCAQIFRQIWNILAVPSSTQLILCANSVLNLEDIFEDLPSSVSLIDYGFQEMKIWPENILDLFEIPTELDILSKSHDVFIICCYKYLSLIFLGFRPIILLRIIYPN